MAVITHVSQDSDQELNKIIIEDVLGPWIQPNKATVYNEFESSILFNGEDVLPWIAYSTAWQLSSLLENTGWVAEVAEAEP